jgi:hypothetical protein
MRRITAGPLLFVTCIAASPGFSGCSMIGYFVGGSIDNSKPNLETVADRELPDLEAETWVQVTQRDSTRIVGTFLRMDHVTPETYVAWYSTHAGALVGDSMLPLPGQAISLAFNHQFFRHVGSFIGFDSWSIHWRETPSHVIMQTPFEFLADLRPEPGKSIAGEDLRTLVHSKGIPSVAAIRILTSASEQLIPMEEIARVEVKVTKNAQLTLGLVGAALDVAAVVAALIAWSQFQDHSL